MDFSKLNLEDNQVLARKIILAAAGKTFSDRRAFEKFRNKIVKENKGKIFHNLYFIKAYNDLRKEGLIEENSSLLALIQKRSIRTMSGVTPVTVLTKPHPCPGKCTYCPTDVRMPKSYLPSQPAAQRAFRQQFNPYTQVFVRLKAMAMTGHEVSKVELRIIGGTWSSYPKYYQRWFIKMCLLAMNEFHKQMENKKTLDMAKITKSSKVKSIYGEDEINTVILEPLSKERVSFEDVVKVNETASVRCIGLNIETRSDHIDEAEVKRLRSLGVTKVEMGVQTTDDYVQELTRRGHDLQSVKDATKLLKDAGFKMSYHMMPNLEGATLEKDKRMIGDLFSDEAYQPDYLKIYPCVVIPKTALSIKYRRGEYKPYDDKTLMKVLKQNLKDVPEYCRVDRIARDIPAPDIEAGFKISNIRQYLEKELESEGTPSRDIRSREIMRASHKKEDIQLVVREYEASGGKEYFLSYEDIVQDKLIALLRLRIPGRTFIPELKGAALVREVHVYGKQLAVGENVPGEKQHVGWGTKLMIDSERITKENGLDKIAVISGIGVREYYKKKGYHIEGTYMVKGL